jgi:Cys-rich four helix bundle protein (predicted Tat secretion target)
MERRQFFENAALFGLAATVGPAIAKATEMGAKASPLLLTATEGLRMLPKFAEMASACATKGDICVQHCEEQLAGGATEFAGCSIASSQMAIICGAVAKLAAQKSVRLSEMLDVCGSACKACKDACEEHKAHWKHGMHLECKACAEHCDGLIAEVAKLKAALGKG